MLAKRHVGVMVEHFARDPIPADRSSARALLVPREWEVVAPGSGRFSKVGCGPNFDRSSQDLQAIEQWVSGQSSADEARMDTTIEELDMLLSWLVADVVVRRAADTLGIA